ncbi:IS3 family transposase [Qipengyuania flava]|uniref:IS3 family transposase n=6 Tax=Erythrobacteraceae TaxID=335929 RepID=A0A5P6NBF7_9SPHN|nr:IS3 family transposase [Oceanicaulis sp.]MXO54361.1 IS3 family transposase [Qipengyuania pelagi]QFI61987.1 IS3 family transposase [Qipengyuania flava]QFI61993.1 IS3 family transposase [Qipengyuania flava]QFI63360.1 IS3 family transposase [Qipengyuania flava]
MKPKSSRSKLPAEQVVKDIRRKTRRHFSSEDKIRIVLEGLRGDDSIAELCRKEGIAQSLYYTWSKEFMEAGKRRLAGDTARAATTDEVRDLRREARDLKECVADLILENRLLKKKHDRGWGRRRMRYPASEKLEIIRIVEQSHLPAKRTLDQLGVARRTFYRWYDRYLEGGPEALADRSSTPIRVWNRIAPEVQDQIVEMALEQTDLSPRELAVRFTDEKRYFVSEATVYRLLKAHDLITSPAYTVIKAAEAFHTQTTRPNEMWQTDFTYFKIIGWGWVYLSTVLDDYSRYIIAWKLCTTMRAEDVTDTLDMALAASGCDHANVLHRPRLLSDNGPSYIAGELAEYIEANRMSHVRGAPFHPQTQGKIERWHQTLKNRVLLENYFLPGDLEQQIEAFVEHYNHQRYHESLDNVTPADAYFGRAAAIIKRRERIKRKTLEHRRLQHRKLAA